MTDRHIATSDLIQQVSKVLWTQDPIMIGEGRPSDEYDVEAQKIVTRLPEVFNIESLTQVVFEAFAQSFGVNLAGSLHDYRKVSESVWTLLSSVDAGHIA